MAELAIPMLVLGGLYVMSNQRTHPKPNTPDSTLDHTENFTNMKHGKSGQTRWDGKSPSLQKYPSTTKCAGELLECNSKNLNKYDGTYDSKEQFSDKKLYQNGVNANAIGHKMMSGETINNDNFKHNNMVPFFGSKIRGLQPDMNVHEGLMDSMQGTGSLHRQKRETGAFFKNNNNFTHIHGTPNNTEFYMQRMQPSMKMQKIQSWETERVGPNSGKEHAMKGEDGFNIGMQGRDQWKPRTVDQLRSGSNPKVTENFMNRTGGPENMPVKKMGQIGKMEQYNPDAFFEYTPDMWNAGINSSSLGPTARVNRGEKGQKLLDKNFDTGAQIVQGASGVKESYSDRNYLPSKSQTGLHESKEYDHMNVRRMSAPNMIDQDTHIRDGLTHKATYRSVTYDNNYENTFMGAVNGTVKALISPIKHIIKPTQKEDIFMKHRELSNYHQDIQKPEARDFESVRHTTNREIFEDKLGMSHVQMQTKQTHPARENYQLGKYEEGTMHERYGAASGNMNTGKIDIHHMNQYHIQDDKSKILKQDRTTHGNANFFAPQVNMRTARMEPLEERKRFEGLKGSVSIPSVHTFGVTNSQFSNTEISTVNDRLNPDILSAFKANPYTQSLHSVA